jgi:ribosomal protein S18 acetylase RimI-like enzyme
MSPFSPLELTVAAEDEAYVDELLLADALEELAVLPDPVRADLAALQVRARRAAYAAEWPEAVDYLVSVDGGRAGRLLVHTDVTGFHVIDIRLHPSRRGQGIGTRVLETVCDDADRAHLRVTLSVRVGTTTEAWYRRHGFVDVAAERDPAAADVALVRPALGEPPHA